MPKTASPTAATPAPILVEVTRGDLVESCHRGAIAVVSADGTLVAHWGDVDRPVFARSAIKPLQALPLVESGAADAFRLAPRHLALACASHSGEDAHASTVTDWLNGIGLSVGDLECGTHLPYDPTASETMIRTGAKPTAAHNNCSGKHSGFLTVCRHLGDKPRGYVAREHPAMRRMMDALSEATGEDAHSAPTGTDGCGIPVIGLSLRATALGMARMAQPEAFKAPARRGEAARRLTQAMMAEPAMVAGTGRFCTVAMAAMAGAAFVKTGAEGVFIAGLPKLGIGIALKIEDGTTRASEVAMGALLRHYKVIDDAMATRLGAILRPQLTNRAGAIVGEVRAATFL